MLPQSCNFSIRPLHNSVNLFASTAAPFLKARKKPRVPPLSFRCASELASHAIAFGNIADVLHNKVLVAAAVSAAIGQLSKPLTSTILYREKFDLKTAVQAGRFPSTHSAAVVATATSLALERGFADAVFGLAVVFASLIMYDAQGVRREVGIHAKVLNKVMLETMSNLKSPVNEANDITNSLSRTPFLNMEKINTLPLEDETSIETKPSKSSLLVKPDELKESTILSRSGVVLSDLKEGSEQVAYVYTPLKESVGHTEIEVAAGALLGFVVSLLVFPYV